MFHFLLFYFNAWLKRISFRWILVCVCGRVRVRASVCVCACLHVCVCVLCWSNLNLFEKNVWIRFWWQDAAAFQPSKIDETEKRKLQFKLGRFSQNYSLSWVVVTNVYVTSRERKQKDYATFSFQPFSPSLMEAHFLTYTHKHIHTHTHTKTRIFTLRDTQTHTLSRTHTHTDIHTFTCTHADFAFKSQKRVIKSKSLILRWNLNGNLKGS